MSSASEVNVQARRYQQWMELANYHVFYPNLAAKAAEASYGKNIGPASVMALVFGMLAMMITMIGAEKACGGIDVDSLTFQLGTGITAFVCSLIIYSGYRHAAKHRREIEDDKDEEGKGLYQRTLDKDQAHIRQRQKKAVRISQAIISATDGEKMSAKANK